MEHFQSLVDGLSLNDIEILNVLSSKESLSKYSGRTKKEVYESTQMTNSLFRKCILRLEAMKFIAIVPGSREHLLHITEFGQEAIQNIYERSNA